eukprot:gene10626-284_t
MRFVAIAMPCDALAYSLVPLAALSCPGQDRPDAIKESIHTTAMQPQPVREWVQYHKSNRAISQARLGLPLPSSSCSRSPHRKPSVSSASAEPGSLLSLLHPSAPTSCQRSQSCRSSVASQAPGHRDAFTDEVVLPGGPSDQQSCSRRPSRASRSPSSKQPLTSSGSQPLASGKSLHAKGKASSRAGGPGSPHKAHGHSFGDPTLDPLPAPTLPPADHEQSLLAAGQRSLSGSGGGQTYSAPGGKQNPGSSADHELLPSEAPELTQRSTQLGACPDQSLLSVISPLGPGYRGLQELLPRQVPISSPVQPPLGSPEQHSRGSTLAPAVNNATSCPGSPSPAPEHGPEQAFSSVQHTVAFPGPDKSTCVPLSLAQEGSPTSSQGTGGDNYVYRLLQGGTFADPSPSQDPPECSPQPSPGGKHACPAHDAVAEQTPLVPTRPSPVRPDPLVHAEPTANTLTHEGAPGHSMSGPDRVDGLGPSGPVAHIKRSSGAWGTPRKAVTTAPQKGLACTQSSRSPSPEPPFPTDPLETLQEPVADVFGSYMMQLAPAGFRSLPGTPEPPHDSETAGILDDEKIVLRQQVAALKQKKAEYKQYSAYLAERLAGGANTLIELADVRQDNTRLSARIAELEAQANPSGQQTTSQPQPTAIASLECHMPATSPLSPADSVTLALSPPEPLRPAPQLNATPDFALVPSPQAGPSSTITNPELLQDLGHMLEAVCCPTGQAGQAAVGSLQALVSLALGQGAIVGATTGAHTAQHDESRRLAGLVADLAVGSARQLARCSEEGAALSGRLSMASTACDNLAATLVDMRHQIQSVSASEGSKQHAAQLELLLQRLQDVTSLSGALEERSLEACRRADSAEAAAADANTRASEAQDATTRASYRAQAAEAQLAAAQASLGAATDRVGGLQSQLDQQASLTSHISAQDEVSRTTMHQLQEQSAEQCRRFEAAADEVAGLQRKCIKLRQVVAAAEALAANKQQEADSFQEKLRMVEVSRSEAAQAAEFTLQKSQAEIDFLKEERSRQEDTIRALEAQATLLAGQTGEEAGRLQATVAELKLAADRFAQREAELISHRQTDADQIAQLQKDLMELQECQHTHQQNNATLILKLRTLELAHEKVQADAVESAKIHQSTTESLEHHREKVDTLQSEASSLISQLKKLQNQSTQAEQLLQNSRVSASRDAAIAESSLAHLTNEQRSAALSASLSIEALRYLCSEPTMAPLHQPSAPADVLTLEACHRLHIMYSYQEHLATFCIDTLWKSPQPPQIQYDTALQTVCRDEESTRRWLQCVEQSLSLSVLSAAKPPACSQGLTVQDVITSDESNFRERVADLEMDFRAAILSQHTLSSSMLQSVAPSSAPHSPPPASPLGSPTWLKIPTPSASTELSSMPTKQPHCQSAPCTPTRTPAPSVPYPPPSRRGSTGVAPTISYLQSSCVHLTQGQGSSPSAWAARHDAKGKDPWPTTIQEPRRTGSYLDPTRVANPRMALPALETTSCQQVPCMGISVSSAYPVSGPLDQSDGLPPQVGQVVRIDEVQVSGPSKAAGLLAGDMIASINAIPILSLDDFRTLVVQIAPGGLMLVHVVRSGTQHVTVRLLTHDVDPIGSLTPTDVARSPLGKSHTFASSYAAAHVANLQSTPGRAHDRISVSSPGSGNCMTAMPGALVNKPMNAWSRPQATTASVATCSNRVSGSVTIFPNTPRTTPGDQLSMMTMDTVPNALGWNSPAVPLNSSMSCHPALGDIVDQSTGSPVLNVSSALVQVISLILPLS